jgi:hypothetical protein
MVENLAESPWTCSDGPGSAPNKIPKGVSFLEREQEREGGRGPWSGWRRERGPPITSRGLGPTRAQNPRTVRSATPTWTVRYLLQNDQCCTSSPRAARTVRASLVDSLPGAAGQSDPLPRTVRPPFSILA